MKKWIEILKGEVFSETTFQYFIEAFRAILTKNPSAESLRSLALYITYATYKPKNLNFASAGPNRRTTLRIEDPFKQKPLSASPSPIRRRDTERLDLSSLEVAIKVMEMYTDLLCATSDLATIKKFARAVTNKASARRRLLP